MRRTGAAGEGGREGCIIPAVPHTRKAPVRSEAGGTGKSHDETRPAAPPSGKTKRLHTIALFSYLPLSLHLWLVFVPSILYVCAALSSVLGQMSGKLSSETSQRGFRFRSIGKTPSGHSEEDGHGEYSSHGGMGAGRSRQRPSRTVFVRWFAGWPVPDGPGERQKSFFVIACGADGGNDYEKSDQRQGSGVYWRNVQRN